MSTEPKIITLWDKETMEKAQKQHKYVYVSAGQKQKKFKLLTGAEKAWKPTQNKPLVPYVYLSELKIMGLKEDVTEELKRRGLSDNEIKAHFKTAYTKDNHGDDYKAEIEQLKAYRKTIEANRHDDIKFGLEDLEWFVEALKEVKEEPIENAALKANKATPQSKRDLFLALYQKGKETQKIVDVSTLEGVGAKLRDQPSKKGNKVYNEELNMETDNIKTYKKAIEWIFGSLTEHEANIDSVKTALSERKRTGGHKKTEKKDKPVESKKEQPKKQLGSPRKQALPGSKSPGAIRVTGGDNFTSIPPLNKK
jgi:hypothetical protein